MSLIQVHLHGLRSTHISAFVQFAALLFLLDFLHHCTFIQNIDIILNLLGLGGRGFEVFCK